MRAEPGELVRALAEHFGSQRWWPADSALEVLVGAVLTQNTAWRNVEAAIANLKAAGALGLDTLLSLPAQRVCELIRPAGFFRQKERKLRGLLSWFRSACGGDPDLLEQAGTDELRAQLLALWGIGPETADAILLYVFARPVFIADAYTIRILARHGMAAPGAGYEQVRALGAAELPREAAYLNEAHALLVAAGKSFCRKTRPRCGSCPLEKFLPDGGPVEIGMR